MSSKMDIPFAKVKPLTKVFQHSEVYFCAMAPNRLLDAVLGILLTYNAVFTAAQWMGESRALAAAMSDMQSVINVLELLAVGTLFVDLVLRYDHLSDRWRIPRVMGVGLCLTGMLFKWFILYLHLSYLVD
tara:strand:+ start:358 stop:747 length:390 start_codon:yes stop_codon:yes gene_type:complete